jgi:transglutaminase-like putative cysteine protease
MNLLSWLNSSGKMLSHLPNMKTCRFFIILAAVALVVLPVRGGTNDYTGPVWAFEDARTILAAAAEITPAKYPDCDEATVEQKSVRVFRPDGTGESQDETFTKVLTEKGRRENRTLSLEFMLPYATVAVVKLEVLKPDGTAQPVDVAANSKESINDSQMAENICNPNDRVLQVNLPKVEIGDVVHSIVRQTTERAYIPGQFTEENVFEGDGFIRHISYEVHAPAERPLKCVRLRAEISGTVKYAGETNADGSITYRWDVAGVPRMFAEPGMPPYDNVLQRLLVSTLPDWPAVSKWYWDLSEPHLDATTPEMEKTVFALTAGATTDLEKIKALFYHVSKYVRYAGLTLEKDRPGFEPHDVKLTFEKNYGVCRDKAALLVAMLREAGLDAYPVLINVGSRLDPEVPSPDFNHAIVCVERKKGDYLLMDPTDENTRELLPEYDCDRSYLVCRPEGEKLRTSPVQPPEQNLMRVKTTGTLTAAGLLEAKSELSFEGVNDDDYRNAFVKMKPDDVRRFFERDLKRAVPGAKLKSLKLLPENLLDMSSGLRAELEFSAEGMTASGHGLSVVSVPWIGSGLGVVNFILTGTGLEKRKYPLQTGVTCGLAETVSLKLGKGFTGTVSLPDCAPQDNECLSRQETFAGTNGTLDCARELKLKTVEFSPAQYLQLKQTLKEMQYDSRKPPLMAVAQTAPETPAAPDSSALAPVNSDAKILYVRKELTVTGAHSAVYRVKYSKQILSYEGKKREAELKLDFNPACQTAKLVRATVISKTGAREEISAGEINLMDAGWNASAKRYTGGKILVANLPDVEIGSTIEVEFEITMTNRPFLAGFESFQLPDELAHKTFELSAPENLKVHKMTSGDGGIRETRHAGAGRQAFDWQAENVKALPAENQLPPDWTFNSGVSYFIGDVDDYYKQLNAILLDRAAQSSQAAARARRLTAAATSRVAAVMAIRDFIVQSIRLAGPSFTELPLAELSTADTTLADGYGHLADRAILFHAMLAAAGFKPEFVLASDLPPVQDITGVLKKFPMPQCFQFPLVRVVVDGETYYLNDTDQYSHLGTTAHDGKLGIVLTSRAGVEIKAARGCATETKTFYHLSIADDGRARIGVSQSFYGVNFNGKHRYFAELPPEERRRYFQEIVSQVSQGARPVGGLTTRFDTYPGTEEFTVAVDNYAVVDGKYACFDLPFSASLFAAGADRRALPLFISQDSKEIVSAAIDLPPGFPRTVIAPKSEKLEAPGGTARITLTSRNGGHCVITDELETSPAIVSPKNYPKMLKVESALRQASARVFLLEKK